MLDDSCPRRPIVRQRIGFVQVRYLVIVCIALTLFPPPVSSQESFSLSADVDDAAGNQGATTAEVSREAAVSIQVFAGNVGQAQGLLIRLVYDSGQVVYDGAEPGDLFPDARLAEQTGTEPTSITLDITSHSGRPSASAGLAATVGFRTRTAFTGTTIRIVEAILGADGRQDTFKVNVAIELTQAPAGPSPDFDADGTVGFPDFLLFALHFGSTEGDGEYDARFDLNADASVGFSDFLIFAERFGQSVPVPSPDRHVLVALYHATGGYSWTTQTNWLTDNPISTWHGVTVVNGRVTSLSLGQNNLTGTLPSELGNLAELKDLHLYQNQLRGPIPAMLGDLTRLTILYLDQNELTGAIPSELGNLVELAQLSLYRNQLTGEIPSELDNLVNVTNLNLSQNQLTGAIPSELGNLAELKHLNLYQNRLSGLIPASLGNLSNLEVLALHQNGLSGSIPPELADLSSLTGLTLSANKLSGTIPAVLGNLTRLTVWYLDQNELTGAVPSELGKLTELTHLILHDNKLSGPIPASLGNLANLEVLQLHENALDGTVPPELGNLTRLQFLSFNGNALSGALPQSLTALTELGAFVFVGNSGLCAPLDASFQAWLQAVKAFDGPNCSQ